MTITPAATVVRSAMVRTRLTSPSRPAPSLFWLPGLKSAPWWDGTSLPWVRTLEANASVIAEEYQELRQKNIDSDYELRDGESTLHSGDWSWHSLVQKGRWSTAQEHCPKTKDILSGIPDLMTGVPVSYSFFSTLKPGATIAPHFGPCNIRLRCHLGLEIPSSDTEKCGIRVGEVSHPWEAGKVLVFDDAYEHETWNTTDRERVVLLVDFWHPEVSQSERQAIIEMFQSQGD